MSYRTKNNRFVGAPQLAVYTRVYLVKNRIIENLAITGHWITYSTNRFRLCMPSHAIVKNQCSPLNAGFFIVSLKPPPKEVVIEPVRL